MKIKKINAFLSLLTIAAIFVHIGYIAYAYLTFNFDPTIKAITSRPFMLFACLHAVLSMGIVFFSSDGTTLDRYPKKNVETILQRGSAILILPLLFLHINTFDILTFCASGGKWVLYSVVTVTQPLFYGIALLHVAVSLSRALITLGWLSSTEKKKTVDLIVRIVCVIFFLVVSFAVIKGELTVFLPSGGVE